VSLVQGQFDCVLFDTAPALPFPDARLWAKHADGIVLIVRAGVTTREGASAACERFLSDGIPVLGTILNDWTPQADSGMAYYYYNRYSSAGPKR
jgi:Mrp family chromosome partitioning ATPase